MLEQKISPNGNPVNAETPAAKALGQALSQAQAYVTKTFEETRAIQQKFLDEHRLTLARAAQALGTCIRNGGKVLICGNGGSAADSQHMAAEMVGRMLIERRPLPAIALSTDTSNITAVANDYGYDVIFLKQVQALARPEDMLVAISTSGKSKNVLEAVKHVKSLGCKVIGLTGGPGGPLAALADFNLNASLGTNSSRIQETHIFAVHSLVDLLDRFFLEG